MHTNNPDYPEQPAYKPSPSDEQEQPRKKAGKFQEVTNWKTIRSSQVPNACVFEAQVNYVKSERQRQAQCLPNNQRIENQKKGKALCLRKAHYN